MGIAEGVLLSSWNCILGPKVECLWLPDSEPTCNLYESTLQQLKSTSFSNDFNKYQAKNSDQAGYGNLHTCLDSPSGTQNSTKTSRIKKVLKICGQLLVGKAEQNHYLQTKSRFFISEDNHIVISSVLFYKRPDLSDNEKSFNREGVWFCLASFFRFSALQSILGMRYMIDLHLRKSANAIQKVTDSLKTASEDVTVIVHDLYSSLNLIAGCDHGLKQVSIVELCSNAENLEFISKAISCHLQTHCISVVIGNSEHQINQVAQLLMMFSSENEKYSFQQNGKTNALSYVDGLCVQGFIGDINQAVDMLSKLDVNQNPIAVIDTTNKVIQKFHITKNHDAEENRCSLEIITDSGLLVREILEKVLLLVRNGESPLLTVNEFCKLLKLKATISLKIVRKSRAFGIPSKRELMTILGLHETADLKVILGYAEKLRPGISNLIR